MGASPKALFKYVNPDRVDIIENLQIRFTPPTDFNDPFDMVPAIELFNEQTIVPTMQRAVVRVYWERVFSGQHVPRQDKFHQEQAGAAAAAKKFIEDNPEMVKQNAIRSLSKRVYETTGVLSLTETENSILMWSHYTDSHKGLLIEFDPSHPFFSQQLMNWNLDFGTLSRVIYSHTRPKFKLGTRQDSNEPFVTKHIDWQYEQEWRGFRRFDECDRRIEKAGGAIHLFKLPAETIKRVVIGCNMTRGTLDRLKFAIGKHPNLSKVLLERAEPDHDKFVLNYIRV